MGGEDAVGFSAHKQHEFAIRRANWEFVLQIPLDPFSQHESMLSRKPARVVATLQDQVVGLGDDDQFFLLLHGGLRCF